jgi:hypothetical protein
MTDFDIYNGRKPGVNRGFHKGLAIMLVLTGILYYGAWVALT